MVESAFLAAANELIIDEHSDIGEFKPLKGHFKKYKSLDGRTRSKLRRISSGSIIQRFEHTPFPKKDTDVICPHFIELKWGYGCPFDCAWCFLKGTLRMLPEKTAPKTKPRKKILKHVLSAFYHAKNPEMFNTGELCDSLMDERNGDPFSKWIINIFQTQRKHKVLFLTKSSYVKNLLGIEEHSQAIASFSLNAYGVSRKWEKAPTPQSRIKAGKALADAGWDVRIRMDPIVPIRGWKKSYGRLVETIYSNFEPSVVTLGTPRGLQSTLNNVVDDSWTKYLDDKQSGWGRKIADEKREEIYRYLIDKLEGHTKSSNIGLCKETLEMFKILDRDFRKQKCNCIL